MRLNAYLAKSGVASRRGADRLIKEARVKVNGQLGQLNSDVSDADQITVDNQPITAAKLSYVLLYKPVGYVTTMKDPQGRPKVADLVTTAERLVPVGRLDRDTTGALLLTNDGQLAHRLMHPSFEVDKVYEATVEGKIDAEKLNKLSNGIDIDGKMTAPAKITKLSDNRLELVIHEGRKHQVKKMLAKTELPVKKLHRKRYSFMDLTGLKPGQWRYLSDQEISRLKVIQ
jgi:23S rRNA pseudouridine2605 synthase